MCHDVLAALAPSCWCTLLLAVTACYSLACLLPLPCCTLSLAAAWLVQVPLVLPSSIAFLTTQPAGFRLFYHCSFHLPPPFSVTAHSMRLLTPLPCMAQQAAAGRFVLLTTPHLRFCFYTTAFIADRSLLPAHMHRMLLASTATGQACCTFHPANFNCKWGDQRSGFTTGHPCHGLTRRVISYSCGWWRRQAPTNYVMNKPSILLSVWAASWVVRECTIACKPWVHGCGGATPAQN